MRKATLMMLLAVVSSSAWAEWLEVGGSDTYTTYADPATIRRNGDNVKMWDLSDYKTPVVVNDHKSYLSRMKQYEYDCKEERIRTLALRFYSNNMGGGEAIYTDSDPGKWSPVTPGTVGEDLWKFACAKTHCGLAFRASAFLGSEGQRAQTLQICLAEAERGDAYAQFILGVLYKRGEGVRRDNALAVAWWRKAAEQGYDIAENALAGMYSKGEGVPQDYEQAVAWYRKAAENGDSNAKITLGPLYGNNAPQDYGQAVAWSRKMAEQGDARTQMLLGLLYDSGLVVPQDYSEALKWYRMAAARGDADAQRNLGYLYRNGHGVPVDYKEAIGWYRKAAEQGGSYTQRVLAEMYRDGQGVSRNVVLAYMLFHLAAGSGDTSSEGDRDRLAKEMTQAQVEEGQALASGWKLGTPLPSSSTH